MAVMGLKFESPSETRTRTSMQIKMLLFSTVSTSQLLIYLFASCFLDIFPAIYMYWVVQLDCPEDAFINTYILPQSWTDSKVN